MEDRARDAEKPPGLKNIGNSKYKHLTSLACYFSSLMQTLFYLPNIQEKILNHDASTVVVPPEKQEKDLQSDGKDEKEDNSKVERQKLVASKEVVEFMKELFVEMLISNRKYADPTKVLEAIVDNNAQKLTIYEQKDIGEFF